MGFSYALVICRHDCKWLLKYSVWGGAGLMKLSAGKFFRQVGATILLSIASSVAAQPMTAQAVKDATVVDIPFVLGDIDPGERSDTLWVKGNKPVNSLLARFSIKPVQMASLIADGSGRSDVVLWRAFAGGGIKLLRSDQLNLAEGARYFCGSIGDPRSLVCYIDEDRNGSFERVADAIPERGPKTYHVTIIKGAQLLDKPLAYKILPDEQRPAITVELRNCGKDYDYPRFIALSKADQAVPVMPTAFGWHAKDSSFAFCRRGRQINALPEDKISVLAGGYLAQIGPLAFTVGPKQQPVLTLIGPADPGALFRLEGATLVDIRVGNTPNQAQLIAAKKFPYPMMMANEGASVHSGPLTVGGRLATVPFHHAYRGKLTQGVTIATLFGKRSLSAGTVVYGFAAQSRITRTVRGIPDMQAVGDDDYRKINLELTWCAPVHGETPAKDAQNAIGKNGWSAACIPQSTLGNHTIIANMQPAFAITGVSYNIETASNDGPPPIQRADETEFEQPLRIDYIYEGREAEFISLREQIYFGSELTSSRLNKLYAPSGLVMVEVAGMQAELKASENGDLTIRPTGDIVVGSSPILKWDQNAYLRQQFQKMGLRMQEPDAASATGAIDSASGQDK